jgi:alkanesulfonate monooxygenase SsuD/methylene tetrahydromethanopterin reductase-like flavin-dependent oxidoreductase (luciferase family)
MPETPAGARLARARGFLAGHARLLDRRRFALLFEGGGAEPVLAALGAYRNPDGGFGHGLEPDLRAPESQPAAALHAFEVLADVAPHVAPEAAQLCDWLEAIALPDGGLPFALPVADPRACAPLWAQADPRVFSVQITAVVAAFAHRVAAHDPAVATHPWLGRATSRCLAAIEESQAKLGAHELAFAIDLLDTVYDREPAATGLLAELGARIPGRWAAAGGRGTARRDAAAVGCRAHAREAGAPAAGTGDGDGRSCAAGGRAGCRWWLVGGLPVLLAGGCAGVAWLCDRAHAVQTARQRHARGRWRCRVRVGIGLPAAVPGADMTSLGQWAAEGERAGFGAVGVFDRLVYDNLDPLVALAVAAARTRRVELLTTVLNVGWRNNPVLLAKQLASVEQVSGGRLTAGLGLGGWPDDYAASQVARTGMGALWASYLATMRAAWAGELGGQGGPMTRLPDRRPGLLLGGLVPAAYQRAARHGQGWVSPLFGLSVLQQGAVATRAAWEQAGRSGRARIVTGRYFSLGEGAEATAEEYLRHYYGDAYFPAARADTVTTPKRLRAELEALAAAGATDVVLYPCSAGLEQVDLLAQALRAAGFPPAPLGGLEALD